MLTLAGRTADIVGILTTSVATGTVVDDAFERLADAVSQGSRGSARARDRATRTSSSA